MTKAETFRLMNMIKNFYEGFIVKQEVIDTWHEVFKRFEYEDVRRNLLRFVVESSYQPKPCDLLPKSDSRTVPNVYETRMMFSDQPKPASEEVAQENMALMRAILGIVR